MSVRGSIPKGSTVTVQFRAPAGNKGTAVAGSVWLGSGDRQTQDSFLIPGGHETHRHTEPGANALRLHLHVPSEGGIIEVEVTANGARIDSGATGTDGFWTYIVQ